MSVAVTAVRAQRSPRGPSTLRSLGIADYRRLWIGSLLQSLGRWVQTATVPYLIYVETRSGAWLGAAAGALFAPGVVTTTLGGVLADRVPRRRLIIAVQAALGLNAAAVAAVWATGHHPAALLLALVAVDGSLFGITAPVRQSVVSDLVPREDLYGAVALNSAQFNVGKAVGPALAGLLLAAVAPLAPLLLVVGLHCCALLAALRMRIPDHASGSRGGLARSFLDGFRAVLAHPGLRAGFVCVCFHALTAASAFSVLPVLSTRVYHTGGLGYGILAAAYGTGALVAAVSTGGRFGALLSGQILRSVAPVYSVALFALALVGWFPAGVLVLAVNGGCFVVVQNAITTSVQRQAALPVRGRVLGAYFTVLTLCLGLGGFMLGALSDRLGIVDTLLLVATLFTAGAVAFASTHHLATAVSGRGDDEPIASTAPEATAARLT